MTKLLSEEQIISGVNRVAKKIVKDHPDGFVAVIVLRSALMFGADLLRACGDSVKDVRFLIHDKPVDFQWTELAGKDVIFIDDMMWKGGTRHQVSKKFEGGKWCVLMNVFPANDERSLFFDNRVDPEYSVFRSDTTKVAGYGIDYDEPELRSKRDIYSVEPRRYPTQRE